MTKNDGRPDWSVIGAVIGCLSTYAITLSLLIPLMSLILEARGTDKTVIGLVAATSAAGTLLFAAIIPKLLSHINIRTFVMICIVSEGVMTLLLPVLDHITAWFVLRFLMGATGAGLFISSETWINQIAPDASRGRIMGIYATVMGATFAIGPAILAWVGTQGNTAFIIGAVIVFVSIIPLLNLKHKVPEFHGGASFNAFSFVLVAPILAAGVMLVAFKESIGFSLMAVYGVRNGMDEAVAALMLTVIAAGSIALQIPIGWTADRINRMVVLSFCALVGLLGSISIPFVMHLPLILWPLLFFWGGIFSGVYTVVMAITGQRFRGSELVTANASFGVLWGVGSMIGPATAGVAMDAWDPHGLIGVMVVGSLLFFVVIGARRLAH